MHGGPLDATARWAADPAKSRGRLHPEPESPSRTPFQRDRDRIIHSTAFRRLKHKTQVFVYHEGDHYRTRLTHSIEVAQIARSVARELGLNEDLAETLALAHDLGHPPFGHAGEDALNTALEATGGFDHNGQSLKVVTQRERRYAEFDGLNLTWETLEGLAKHNGPVEAPRLYLAEYVARHDLELDTWPSAEAQVAALADDIAYHSHDLDDGLRAGLFELDELVAVPVAADALAEVDRAWPGLARERRIHETIRRIINALVVDLVAETARRLRLADPGCSDSVRRAGRPLVGFSASVGEANAAIKAFLFRRMYRHYRVNRQTAKARRVVGELFAVLDGDPSCLPELWAAEAGAAHAPSTARAVGDYIAGMTDRFALDEHRRLFQLDALG